MGFPTSFEDAILDTEIVMQNQQTMRYLRDAEQVRADTRVLQAAITQNITISTANATAYSSKALKYAQANATLITAKNEAEALIALKNGLNLVDSQNSSAANKILTYLWIYVIWVN